MPDSAVEDPNSANPNQPEETHSDLLSRATEELRKFYGHSQVGQPERMTLEARGFAVQTWTMPGGKIALFAQRPTITGAPTLLIYNHFTTPDPNKAELAKQNVQSNGTGSVNAGTFVARLLALDSCGELPLNIKWLVEGQRGKINPALAGLLKKHAAELKADACLWATGGYSPDGRALVNLGTKGVLTVELRSRTLSQAADSSLAGVLPNAAWRLVWALGVLKGENEDIRISGFGDENDSDLFIPDEDISLLMGSVRDHKTRLATRLQEFGLNAYLMELRDPQVLLTEFFTPTANISSFEAGNKSTGKTTIVPAQARATLDFRLVPNHEPAKVLELLKQHLAYRDFGDIEVKTVGLMLKPAYTSPSHPFAQMVIESVQETAEIAPLVIPLSPSAEPIAFFKEVLGDLPIVGLGVGSVISQPDKKSESIRQSEVLAHSQAVARLLSRLAATEPLPEAFSFNDETLPEPFSLTSE